MLSGILMQVDADVTVVVAVDNVHFNELVKTLPTWLKHKNINQFKFLVIVDADEVNMNDARFKIFEGLEVKYVSIDNKLGLYKSQREKMLTALATLPGKYVDTKWYLKIDTDCIAINGDKWFDKTWLKKDYVFISNPWHKTKPKNAIQLLDEWSQKKFNGTYAPLNLPIDEENNCVRHKRIISWLFFCNTEWSQIITAPCVVENDYYKLPSISDKEYKVSQDTFLWYMAEIGKYRYKIFNFKSKGWRHIRV